MIHYVRAAPKAHGRASSGLRIELLRTLVDGEIGELGLDGPDGLRRRSWKAVRPRLSGESRTVAIGRELIATGRCPLLSLVAQKLTDFTYRFVRP
jgi:hypothetical protein